MSFFIEVPCVAGKIVAEVSIRRHPTHDTWDEPGEAAEGDIDEAWIESHSRALERKLTNEELGTLYEREDFQNQFQEAAEEAAREPFDDF